MIETIGFHIAQHVVKLYGEVLLAVAAVLHLRQQGETLRLGFLRIVVVDCLVGVSRVFHGQIGEVTVMPFVRSCLGVQYCGRGL